jgi:hypothetical protein
MHFTSLETIYDRTFKVFSPSLNAVIDICGAIAGSICFFLCYQAALRKRKYIMLLRQLLPIAALYSAFGIFRILYQLGHDIIVSASLGVASAAIPTVLFLWFYYRSQNVDELCRT